MHNEQLFEDFYLLPLADREKMTLVHDKILVTNADLSDQGHLFIETWSENVMIYVPLKTIVDIYEETYGQSKALGVPTLSKLMKSYRFGFIRSLFIKKQEKLKEAGLGPKTQQNSDQRDKMIKGLQPYLAEVTKSHIRPCSSQGEVPGIQFKDLIRAINAVALAQGFKGLLATTKNISDVINYYNLNNQKPIQVGTHNQRKWVLELELSIDKKDGKIYEEFMKGITVPKNPRKNLGKAIADNIERLEAHDQA